MAATTAGPYDLILAGGRVVDGTGAPWYRADVGIRGDRIAAVGDLKDAAAKRRIDACDSSWSPPASSTCSASPSSTCWSTTARPARSPRASPPRSPARATPSAPAQRDDDRRRRGDLRALRRHGRLDDARRLLRAPSRRSASPSTSAPSWARAACARSCSAARSARRRADELKQMEALVAQAMEEGALGLSTSLLYVPSNYATTEEIVALARVAAPLRRQLHHPPARRGRRDRREPRRGLPHRPRGGHPDRDLPPEDGGAEGTGA